MHDIHMFNFKSLQIKLLRRKYALLIKDERAAPCESFYANQLFLALQSEFVTLIPYTRDKAI